MLASTLICLVLLFVFPFEMSVEFVGYLGVFVGILFYIRNGFFKYMFPGHRHAEARYSNRIRIGIIQICSNLFVAVSSLFAIYPEEASRIMHIVDHTIGTCAGG